MNLTQKEKEYLIKEYSNSYYNLNIIEEGKNYLVYKTKVKDKIRLYVFVSKNSKYNIYSKVSANNVSKGLWKITFAEGTNNKNYNDVSRVSFTSSIVGMTIKTQAKTIETMKETARKLANIAEEKYASNIRAEVNFYRNWKNPD